MRERRAWSGHLVLLLFAAALGLAVHSRAVTSIFRTGDPGQEAPLTTGQDAVIALPGALADGQENTPAEYGMSGIPVLVDVALQPSMSPFTFRPRAPEHAFVTYTVQSGDTAIGIAEQFGIREETILGGNSFLQNDAGQLWAGTEIVILPVDGVLHNVVEGDTLEGLSTQYDVALEEIVAYGPNNLEFPYRLIAGTQLLIPGAIAEVWFWDPPSFAPAAGGSSPEAMQGVYVAVPGTGTFIRPWTGGRITQNPWYGHMAVDIGLVTGSPIYASDTGTVTYAAWSPYGYGNLVVINHGNGFETFYAHLDGFDVQPGQTVYQGNLIAWSGNTGKSSGPHLHFEIRFQKQRENPWTYIP
jgi:murein DD-endopeptidase MepM/ murein hydrolase activator NlpD